MNTMTQTFRLTSLSAALMLAFTPALAQDASLEELAKPESSVSLGIGNGWGDNRHQMGIYDGMRDNHAYGLFDADINVRDDATGTWYKLDARNVGLDNRDIRVEVLRQGNIGGYLEYNRTPRDNPYTFFTGLQGIGTPRLVVGSANAPKREETLGTVREMLNAGFYKNLMPGLDFKLDFKNEDKKGTRQWGESQRFLVEPIDSTTRQFETLLQYSGKNLQLSGGYYGSWYDQDNGGVVRYSTNNGGTFTTMSQPLSNQAHQLFLDGGYNFTPTTRGTFKVSYSRATQDEPFPTNNFVTPRVGTPSNLDGRVDTKLVQLGLSSRPLANLSLNANLRYHDIDDKTQVYQFINSQLGFNTPHSFKKLSGKVEGTYRLPMNFALTAGVDHFTQDRSTPKRGQWLVPYVKEIEETTYRVQLRRSFDESLNGSIAYLRSDRKGSGFVAATTGDPQESQISPMHIADRVRDKLRAKVDWEPVERLSLQFTVEGSDDQYDKNRPWGLKEGNAWLTSVDASYIFNDDWKLSAWLSREEMSSSQDVASTGGAVQANHVELEEVTNSLGLGLLGKLGPKFTFSADLEWMRSVTKHEQNMRITTFNANFRPVPDIENKLTRLKLKGTYALRKNADLRFDLIHDRWHTDDWSWSSASGAPFCFNNCVGGVGTDGTTVLASPSQNATFAGIRYIYKFQ